MEASWYMKLRINKGDAECLADMDQALDKANLRKWFIEYDPPANNGYMFDTHPNFKEIHKHMTTLDRHSGTSYAITCRHLKKILCMGYHVYEMTKLMDNMILDLKVSNDPELVKQGQILEQYRDGKISYADMRSHCG